MVLCYGHDQEVSKKEFTFQNVKKLLDYEEVTKLTLFSDLTLINNN